MENSTASDNSAKATDISAKQQNPDQKQSVMKDICAKWDKFSEQDVSALKGKSDLVSQVVAKYSLPQMQAQKGRQIGAGA